MTRTHDATLIQDRELLIERTFDAPPDAVFRVWTKPEHLMRWWGPKAFTVTHYQMDFRPGGAYRACIRSPQGQDYWMSGTYREIVPAQRIVMTFAWEPDGGPVEDTLVTVNFRGEGGRTRFSFHQAPFASVESRDSHLGGWGECVDRLAAYLAAEGLG